MIFWFIRLEKKTMIVSQLLEEFIKIMFIILMIMAKPSHRKNSLVIHILQTLLSYSGKWTKQFSCKSCEVYFNQSKIKLFYFISSYFISYFWF
jgi:hypothetical protein